MQHAMRRLETGRGAQQLSDRSRAQQLTVRARRASPCWSSTPRAGGGGGPSMQAAAAAAVDAASVGRSRGRVLRPIRRSSVDRTALVGWQHVFVGWQHVGRRRVGRSMARRSAARAVRGTAVGTPAVGTSVVDKVVVVNAAVTAQRHPGTHKRPLRITRKNVDRIGRNVVDVEARH